MNAFLKQPADYLREGDNIEFKKDIGSLGTGFIITPDGYILTNAHVVQPAEEELKKASLASIAELVWDDVARLQKLVEQSLSGETIDQDGVARLQDALVSFYAQRAQIQFSRTISAIMPSAQGDSADRLTEQRCELKQVGEPSPGKDIAVLKIEGTDLPTIPLAPTGEESETRVGNELLVFGYPGKVALDSSFTLQSRMQPSLTIGHVSGIKQMSDGWDVIQTDTSVNPGNSGGPAMNDRGQVVGLATFGFVDSQGLNFAVSSELAKQFLNKLNIKPRESAFTQRYNLALAQYEQPDHGDALRLFTQLHRSHPEVGAVTNFVRQMSPAGERAAAPESRSESSGPSPLIFLGVAIAVLALLTFIIL